MKVSAGLPDGFSSALPSMRVRSILVPMISVLIICGTRAFAGPGALVRQDGAVRLFSPRPAVSPSASAQNPAFSPDGLEILFTVFENGYNFGPAHLWLMNLDGSNPRMITSPGDFDEVNLPGSSWSPARGEIVFSSEKVDRPEIWRALPDGSLPIRITNHATGGAYQEPSWSPDGQRIVFEDATAGGTGDLRLVSPEGGGEVGLIVGSFDDRQPNWAPLGRTIVFQRFDPTEGNWDLWRIDSDGSNLWALTSTPLLEETDVSWSPTGREIVFSSDAPGLNHAEIFIMPFEGAGSVRVTISPDRTSSAPSWSPDGKFIAFESASAALEGSPTDIWIIGAPRAEARGSAWVRYR